MGLLVAPLMPAVVLFPLLPAASHSDLPGFFWMIALVSYPAAILIGLPVYFVLQYARFTTFRTYVLTGAIFGTVLAVLMAAAQVHNAVISGPPFGDWLGFAGNLAVVLLVAVLIVVSVASVFWLVARPDKGSMLRGPEHSRPRSLPSR